MQSFCNNRVKHLIFKLLNKLVIYAFNKRLMEYFMKSILTLLLALVYFRAAYMPATGAEVTIESVFNILNSTWGSNR